MPGRQTGQGWARGMWGEGGEPRSPQLIEMDRGLPRGAQEGRAGDGGYQDFCLDLLRMDFPGSSDPVGENTRVAFLTFLVAPWGPRKNSWGRVVVILTLLAGELPGREAKVAKRDCEPVISEALGKTPKEERSLTSLEAVGEW